jgi:hypothetical protein
MLPMMTMLTAPITSMTGRIDSSGHVASLFSLFGILMPKGRSSSIRHLSGFAWVGNTSLRVYHSFGACVSSYLFALSLEQYLWFICYYVVYETMFYVLCVPCGTLCL